jgi:hypothetical protein
MTHWEEILRRCLGIEGTPQLATANRGIVTRSKYIGKTPPSKNQKLLSRTAPLDEGITNFFKSKTTSATIHPPKNRTAGSDARGAGLAEAYQHSIKAWITGDHDLLVACQRA